MEKKDILNSAIFDMKAQYISKYSASSLMKSNFGYEDDLFFSNSNGKVLDLFFQNSRLDNDNVEYAFSISNFFNELAYSNIKCYSLRYYKSDDDIDINTKSINIRNSIVDLLEMRKSKRKFLKNYKMKKNTLATLLNKSFSALADQRRPYASGGGLYPVDVYVYINNVVDIKKGFYQYNPFEKSLRLIESEEIEIGDLGYLSNITYSECNLLIFYLYNTYLNKYKYGDAGGTFALLETGMMMQNLQLIATGLNLGVCDLGGFNEKKILRWLKLNNYYGIYLTNMSIIGGDKNE